MKHNAQNILAHPSTVFLTNQQNKVQRTPKKLARETPNPRNITKRSGFMLGLVIPVTAKEIIFESG